MHFNNRIWYAHNIIISINSLKNHNHYIKKSTRKVLIIKYPFSPPSSTLAIITQRRPQATQGRTDRRTLVTLTLTLWWSAGNKKKHLWKQQFVCWWSTTQTIRTQRIALHLSLPLHLTTNIPLQDAALLYCLLETQLTGCVSKTKRRPNSPKAKPTPTIDHNPRSGLIRQFSTQGTFTTSL